MLTPPYHKTHLKWAPPKMSLAVQTPTTKGYKMKFYKVITCIVLLLLIATCLFALCGCKATANNNCTNCTIQQDVEEDKVSFGKKYYSLDDKGYDKNQYYIFNKDGTATYHVTLTENNKETYKSTINFRWFYAGNGQFLMLHNGTKMDLGQNDGVFGFGRVIHTTKCVMYWDNMYFVAEDCVNSIPNYGKLVGNTKKLLELKKPLAR